MLVLLLLADSSVLAWCPGMLLRLTVTLLLAGGPDEDVSPGGQRNPPNAPTAGLARSNRSTRADRLGREPGDELKSPLYPAGERVVSRVAFRFDTYEAGQSPAGEGDRLYVRLADCLLAVFGTDPDHQRRTCDAAAHIAVDQERQAAHHLLFHHVAAAGQHSPHPLGGARWFRVADTYGVEVAPGQDPVVILAVTAVLDTTAHPER